MAPKAPTVKRLFALSGNECAFPSCLVPIVDRVSGTISGEMAHIKAKSVGGPRYDPQQTAEERHAFENLLLLCPLHHQIVDADVAAYTVERLVQMKVEHERRVTPAGDLADNLAAELIRISEAYVVGGSMILSTSQSGGQIAHIITNIVGTASEPAPARSLIREEEARALRELWAAFQESFGAVFQVASPLQYFADPGRMNTWEFQEWLQKTDLAEWQKNELRMLHPGDRTAYYARIDFARKLAVASARRVAFHNLYVTSRILLSQEIKSLFAEVDSDMADVISKMEMVAEASNPRLRGEAYRLIRATESKVSTLESTISARLRGE